VLNVMADFGTDTARYQRQHDWAARLPRDADFGSVRTGGDMRLSVFHYPITGWADAVVMNVLMGLATGVQMTELTRVSYAPLAEVFREIAPREARHAALGIEGLDRLVATDEGKAQAKAAIAYWRPRVAVTFGIANSARYDTQAKFGLRHATNETLHARWDALVAETLGPIGLN
jgi:1,2-phenylacetyl-CoA epoxidase catalytic subunit